MIASLLERLWVPGYAVDPLATAITLVGAFLVLYAIGRAIAVPLIGRLVERRGLDEHASKPVMRGARALVLFGGLVIALGVAGLQSLLFAFTAVAAAGTLAIGFAMQNVISNFVSGVFIYWDKPFRLGDWIEWNDQAGIVEDIRLRTTRVRTFDNELLTVPNSELTENVVKNPVAYDRIRQRFTVGIGFDDDIAAAIDAMVDEANAHDEILEKPEPSVRLTELGDSAVLLQARFWVDEPNRSDFVRVRGEYGARVKERLDAEGIDIPFPIRTLDGEVTLSDDGAIADQ